MPEANPVELLRDHRGIYGIGVSEAYDIQALAWACGVEEAHNPNPNSLILRPDMLSCATQSYDYDVLQKITGGFRHGMFTHSREESLRRVLHHAALNRAGLTWPPPPTEKYGGHLHYWSTDKRQQDRNRQIYHGLRLGSLRTINNLIGLALQEAADPAALKVARRFAFKYRKAIYCASAKSRFALQLAEAFPVLALHLYCPPDPGDIVRYINIGQTVDNGRRQEASALVDRGARMRDVAALMGVPTALRHIKPGAGAFGNGAP